MDQYYITFPEGKFKALTFSYDDGTVGDRRLVDIFNRYGLKGTFHLNGGLFPTGVDDGTCRQRIMREEVTSLYEGHEVAAHTYTHPTIARCPIDKVAKEVLEDRQALEELVGYPVQGFSYPNGSYNQSIKELLPLLGIEYARIVGDSSNFELPTDWYEWKATCHHNRNLMELGRQFISSDKNQYLYLMYIWGHSFEFDEDDNWELIEAFAQMVAKEKNIWFVTNIEFKRYMNAAERLVFTAKGDKVLNPNGEPIWIRINKEVKKIEPGLNSL